MKKTLIDKNPENRTVSLSTVYYYDRARDAMYDIMAEMAKAGMLKHVLLPAYIGWSPKEGSGIYDPIVKLENLGVNHSFYRVDSRLRVNINDLNTRLIQDRCCPRVLLIVNYFGFPDARAREIVQEAHKYGVFVIADNAHGMYTYLRDGGIGADATFFSIHKMLPYDKGGSLLIRNEDLKKLACSGVLHNETPYMPWVYDLAEISRQRRENYNTLVDVIHSFDSEDLFSFLYDELPDMVVPQSLPILLRKGDRFAVYKSMNAAGYGVVSLYHTLIKPLNNPEYSKSLELSSRILNLPVHQDVNTSLYEDMVELLIECCRQT